MKLERLLTAIVFFAILCRLSITLAENARMPFDCKIATMTAGRNGNIYLSSLAKDGSFILRINPDGTQQVGRVLKNSPSTYNVTANAAGIMATANAHFARKMTLWDRNFNPVGMVVRFNGASFRAPFHVEAGTSGDFYALDQVADRIVRAAPDGTHVKTYRIPHEPLGNGGEPRDFRVCEKNKTFYVLTAAGNEIRCLSFDSTAWRPTCQKLWQVTCNVNLGEPHIGGGNGGFDVDPNGILYVTDNRSGIIKRYAADGKPLPAVNLQIPANLKPTATERGFRYLRILAPDAFLNRQHQTELFQRYDLNTGQLKAVATLDEVTPPANAAPQMPEPAIAKAKAGAPAPLRVLFVGNSQINCVGDIAEIVEDLSHSASATVPQLQTTECVIGGVGLAELWDDGLARRQIEAGKYDYVVLQEIIDRAEDPNGSFPKYARLFSKAVRAGNARMLLFVTANVQARRQNHEIMYKANLAMAHEFGCRVAGGGMAWLKVWEKNPDYMLHYTDHGHPNVQGYYLNACVIYSALTGASPVGLGNYAIGLPLTNGGPLSEVSKADAEFLQPLAWEQVQQDRANEKQ